MSFFKTYGVQIEKAEPIGYIYKITNNDLDKAYIGQTVDVNRRLCQHLEGKGNMDLLRDVVVQGISSFSFEVLETVYDGDIDEKEDAYIEEYNTLHPNGYNKRLNNTMISDTDEKIDLNDIKIEAKFCFSNGNTKHFSVGRFTKWRSYDLLHNILKNTETKNIKHKKKFNFEYFEVLTHSTDKFEENSTYDLVLKYNFNEDMFFIKTHS